MLAPAEIHQQMIQVLGTRDIKATLILSGRIEPERHITTGYILGKESTYLKSSPSVDNHLVSIGRFTLALILEAAVGDPAAEVLGHLVTQPHAYLLLHRIEKDGAIRSKFRYTFLGFFFGKYL